MWSRLLRWRALFATAVRRSIIQHATAKLCTLCQIFIATEVRRCAAFYLLTARRVDHGGRRGSVQAFNGPIQNFTMMPRFIDAINIRT